MKFCGLISGGKDSIYNVIKCIKEGHELICLANLKPRNEKVQELDSFMFQTVGHSVIQQIADAIGVPLIRREFDGVAHQKEITYDTENVEKQDEVEDMFELIKEVKQKFPQVEAVAAGAVLSNYQRNRVENVCQRLGLVSLALLWRKDQEILLEEMIQEGVEAIIIKTACWGLSPQKHCGKTIKELKDHFMHLKQEFGMNVCGEGGEYESLTLDSPIFRKRIIILFSKMKKNNKNSDESVIETVSQDTEASVGHLIVKKSHFGEKPKEFVALQDKFPPNPNAKINCFIYAFEKSSPDFIVQQLEKEKLAKYFKISSNFFDPEMKINGKDQIFHCFATFNYTSSEDNQKESEFIRSVSCFKKTHILLDLVQDFLKQKTGNSNFGIGKQKGLQNILTIKDMNQFANVNKAYSLFFNYMPPSRAVVEDRSLESEIQIEMTFVLNRKERQVLFEQSVSEYCPACIGPYSQATKFQGAIVRASGQIPLVPEKMQLISNFTKIENIINNNSNNSVSSPSVEKSALTIFESLIRTSFNQVVKNNENLLLAINSKIENTIRIVFFYNPIPTLAKTKDFLSQLNSNENYNDLGFDENAKMLEIVQSLWENYANRKRFSKKSKQNSNRLGITSHFLRASCLPMNASMELCITTHDKMEELDLYEDEDEESFSFTRTKFEKIEIEEMTNLEQGSVENEIKNAILERLAVQQEELASKRKSTILRVISLQTGISKLQISKTLENLESSFGICISFALFSPFQNEENSTVFELETIG